MQEPRLYGDEHDGMSLPEQVYLSACEGNSRLRESNFQLNGDMAQQFIESQEQEEDY